MMRQYELVERVTSYDPDADEALLNKAYVYAMKAHGKQTRASGDPYFSHPLEVAAILTDFRLDTATIAAALLHDVVEDTKTTHQEIRELFGEEIASLVEGLTKIKRLDLVTREAAQAENLRKLLLAMAQDVRVLLIKLADRLHNMRTLEHMRPDKQIRIAQETLDIYAPLAARMGMQTIREELENIAFAILEPAAHKTIVERLDQLKRDSGDIITRIENELSQKLRDANMNVTVYGREKRPYSIWSKMERKHLSLSQLSDIFAFRIITETIPECYQALGVVHRNWRVVPGKFKDYISNPKQNDYRSLHTAIIGPSRKRVELQIRTREMEAVAEHGVAAHGFYKDIKDKESSEAGVRIPAATSNAYRWLRHLVDVMSHAEHPKEFLEHTRLELFHDQVFCFTPKGDLIALPKGANAIDFAYAVHTDIGNSCVGARVNGHHAPLLEKLNNGDEVEIITSRAQTPPAAWEGAAVTGKARSAIRRATRLAMRKQYAGLGREILDHCLEQAGARYEQAELDRAVRRLGFSNTDDALAALGRGDFTSVEFLSVMDIELPDDARGVKGRVMKTHNAGKLSAIRGLPENLPAQIYEKTGAVPGERIVGIHSLQDGITVYPIFASKLQEFEDATDRWIDLAWESEESEDVFPARIKVVVHNSIGALADVTRAIGDSGANIENLYLDSRQSDFYELDITVEVHGIKHLARVTDKVKACSKVISVTRRSG